MGDGTEVILGEIAIDLPQGRFWPTTEASISRLLARPIPGNRSASAWGLEILETVPKVIIAATHGPRSGDKTRIV
jgi:hypothetical protein